MKNSLYFFLRQIVDVAPSVSEVAADVTTLRSSVPSLRSRVPAAEVAGEVQPGAYAAGTPASTLVAEPEFESTSPSPQQLNNLTTLSSSTLVAELA